MNASTYARWRSRARALLARGVAPEHADWDTDGLLAGAGERTSDVAAAASVVIPRRLADVLERAACHRDPRRPALMYRVLWRVVHGERGLLDDAADDDVIALLQMARAVDRASHKMTAFVRFRELRDGGDARYIAHFEPEHDVLARTAPFFVRRFGTMVWTIVTPDGAAHWNRHELSFTNADAGAPPPPDAAEALWLSYYESIFNPARLNVAMMRKEMPVAYWKHLPEAQRIPALVHDAMARAGRMVAATSDRVVEPPRAMRCARAVTARATDTAGAPLKAALDACRYCTLGSNATQAVPGTGPSGAALMLVGEQPGDEEDLAGEPFVGPAGRVLRTALADAGVDVADVWITNAVKHFSFEPRGKRRIHKTPAQREIEACRPWLEREIAAVQPRIIVALGASALYGVLHQRMRVTDARAAALLHPSGARVIASYHPSAVLRATDAGTRRTLRAALVEDFRTAASALTG